MINTQLSQNGYELTKFCADLLFSKTFILSFNVAISFSKQPTVLLNSSKTRKSKKSKSLSNDICKIKLSIQYITDIYIFIIMNKKTFNFKKSLLISCPTFGVI